MQRLSMDASRCARVDRATPTATAVDLLPRSIAQRISSGLPTVLATTSRGPISSTRAGGSGPHSRVIVLRHHLGDVLNPEHHRIPGVFAPAPHVLYAVQAAANRRLGDRLHA